jgi:hypothetical protein
MLLALRYSVTSVNGNQITGNLLFKLGSSRRASRIIILASAFMQFRITSPSTETSHVGDTSRFCMLSMDSCRCDPNKLSSTPFSSVCRLTWQLNRIFTLVKYG